MGWRATYAGQAPRSGEGAGAQGRGQGTAPRGAAERPRGPGCAEAGGASVSTLLRDAEPKQQRLLLLVFTLSTEVPLRK